MAGTVQAKWIAITDTRSMHYDLNGNLNNSESTKEAIGSYDKASTCLKMLRTTFTEFQKMRRKQRLLLIRLKAIPIGSTPSFLPLNQRCLRRE